MDATERTTKRIAALNLDQVSEELMDEINKDSKIGIDPSQHYYRVIIGVNSTDMELSYTCYRKAKGGFTTAKVDFDSDKEVNDRRFIFTQNEFDNLLDYLNDFDDSDLHTIARIGQKDVDPISLLPIM